MGKTRDAVDSLFPYEHGDVVFLIQDRWKPRDQRERYTVVARVLIDFGGEQLEIRYRLEREAFASVHIEVSKHAIDEHVNAAPDVNQEAMESLNALREQTYGGIGE